MSRRRKLGDLCALALGCLQAVAAAGATRGAAAPLTFRTAAASTTSGCQLASPKGNIKHVIYVQFDNTHFRRDNPNVPSDLEQMPHLLNFINGNGRLLANDHTVLISHTATGILTSLTGVYPDRMGQPVSNSFRYFKTDGTTRTGVSFAYWTAPLFDPAGSTTDTTPETAEVVSNPGQAFADFVGIGVHCAQGSAVCTAQNSGRPDLLPDEPGDYSDFNGLFGAKYVNPVIKPSGPMTDL